VSNTSLLKRPVEEAVAEQEFERLSVSLDLRMQLIESLETLMRFTRRCLGSSPMCVLDTPGLERPDAIRVLIEANHSSDTIAFHVQRRPSLDRTGRIVPPTNEPGKQIGRGRRRRCQLGPSHANQSCSLRRTDFLTRGQFSIPIFEHSCELDAGVIRQVSQPVVPRLRLDPPLWRIAAIVQRLNEAKHGLQAFPRFSNLVERTLPISGRTYDRPSSGRHQQVAPDDRLARRPSGQVPLAMEIAGTARDGERYHLPRHARSNSPAVVSVATLRSVCPNTCST
jgi:hypothetical protein